MDKLLEIYSDGACSGNPGPGGWGAVLIWGERIKNVSGFAQNSTNNRMELTAAIEALNHIKDPAVKIRLYTDSIYVMHGITKWIISWKKTNWNNGKVKNIDLWQKLDSISSKLDIQWNWVKGHSGNKYNDLADQLARQEIENNK